MTDRNWRGELAEAIGVDPLPSSVPAPLVEGGVTIHDAPATPPAGATSGSGDARGQQEVADRSSQDVEARLARIERLLDADLELLGGAVVAESVEGLAQQLADLRGHVEDVLRLSAAQQPSPVATADVATLAETSAELFEISRRLLRRTDALDKQLADLESANAAMLQRLEEVSGQVAQLLERLAV